MAEARSAIGVFEEHKKGIKLLVSDEGVEVSFVIPHPREIRQNFLRTFFRYVRTIKHGVYPLTPPIVFAVMVTVSAIVLQSSKDSWWRNGWIAWIAWYIGTWCTPFASSLPRPIFLILLASCTALACLVILMTLQKLLLRCLLSYRRWLYLEPKEKSLMVTLWGGALKLLIGRNPLTYSFQAALPRLPLPSLKGTVERYLKSVHPILSDQEYEATEETAIHFLDTDGPKLQRYLTFKSWWSSNYVTDWWEQYVYLKGRSSIMINSNYYVMDSGHYTPTGVQTARAAGIIYQMMMFKQLLDREQLDPLLIRGIVPLCMAQYSRIFATTRIPGRDVDTLKQYGSSSKHLAMLYNGRYYKVPIYSNGRHGKLLSAFEIQRQLTKIKQVGNTLPPASIHERGIAAFTAQGRISWAESREKYFSTGRNKLSLEMIESAVFVVVLDSDTPEIWSDRGRSLMHGSGGDRWFDKSLTLVVFDNGHCGLNAEHSWADAPVVAHLWEHSLAKETMEDMYDDLGLVKSLDQSQHESELPAVSELKLDFSVPGLVASITEAVKNSNEWISDMDLEVIAFNEYGKGFMKSIGVSPDGYIQMAVQLAYYIDSGGQFTQTYESSMTRLYREGRTETVRPVTDLSKAFVLAMVDPTLDKAVKIEKLRQACGMHQQLYRDAMSGKGVDRHLFTLYCVSVGMGIESEFLKNALGRPWRLSTSQQPQQQTAMTKEYFAAANNKGIPSSSIYSPGGGFGPVVDDGYGVSYMITGEDQVCFHVSSKMSSKDTNSVRFASNLSKSFLDIKNLWEN